MKNTKERKTAVITLVEKGLSLSRAAQAAGVHRSTADLWKKNDQAFEREIQAAESRFILRMTDLITVAAETDWRAAAELLRRRFPEDYGIPEKRIALQQINNTVNVGDKDAMEKFRNSPAFNRAILSLARRVTEGTPDIAGALEVEALPASPRN